MNSYRFPMKRTKNHPTKKTCIECGKPIPAHNQNKTSRCCSCNGRHQIAKYTAKKKLITTILLFSILTAAYAYIVTICIQKKMEQNTWFYKYANEMTVKTWYWQDNKWNQNPDHALTSQHGKLLKYTSGIRNNQMVKDWKMTDPTHAPTYNGTINTDSAIYGYEDIINDNGDGDNFSDMILVLTRYTATENRSKYCIIYDLVCATGSYSKKLLWHNTTSDTWKTLFKYSSYNQGKETDNYIIPPCNNGWTPLYDSLYPEISWYLCNGCMPAGDPPDW